MKYFIDTEFLEKPNTIQLISIGIYCESGKQLYLENSTYDVSKDDGEWLKENVYPHMNNNPLGIIRNIPMFKLLYLGMGILR